MAAKRSRKKRTTSAKPRSYSELYKSTSSDAGGEVDSPSSSQSVDSTSGKRGSETVDWQNEYGYIVKDLRTLALVSAVLFVVMIGVGFVI